MLPIRTLIIVMFLSIASGCLVGPNYTRPEYVVPDAWGELAAMQPTTAPATVPSVAMEAPVELAEWWTQFDDPILDELIRRAIESNLDLRAAQARIRQARAQRGIVVAGLFPTANATASYTRERTSDNASVNSEPGIEQSLWIGGFDATWEIDVFGGTRRAVESADANVQFAIESRRDVLVTLLGEVASNYIQLRGFQRQLLIARENLASQQDTLQLTRTREEGGLVTDLDVAQAEAQVATTEATIPSLESSLRQTIHQLGVLLGEPPMSLSSQLLPMQPIPTTPAQIPVGLPSDLLRRRPDIRAAERQLASQTAQIGVATADLFPSFSLTGAFGLESTQFNSWGNWSSRYWTIIPGVSWPIFTAGSVRANIEVQSALQEQALINYEQTILTALQDVEDALVAFSNEQLRRQSLATAVAANRRALDIASQQYMQGLTNFLNVLEAQRALFLSQDELAQSDYTVATNLVALYKALGGGWETDEPAATKETETVPR